MTNTDTADLIGKKGYWTHTGKGIAMRRGAHYDVKFTQRAETFVIDQALIDAATTSKGCWLDLSPEEQVERFGYQLFGIGDKPESVDWWSKDNPAEFELALAAARKAAFALPVEEDRYEALVEVKRKFGTPATSSIHMRIAGDGGKL